MSAEILAIALLAAVALAWVAGGPFLDAARRRRLAQQPMPEEWERFLLRRWPTWRRLPADLRERLKGLVQVFVAEKSFHGCDGFEITDAVRVTIAAQACLLIAARPNDCFARVRSVLVYPGAFEVPVESVDEAGVHATGMEARSGESWQSGQVIFSWEDVRAGALAADGYNVVIHEFAHQLDLEDGGMEGAPLLDGPDQRRSWAAVFQVEFERLREAADRGRYTLIDPYGAHSPPEFFAVASEAFFERAHELARTHTALFDQLRAYYRLDPRAWS
ncbi:MAG: zinc-dependent peptidase [Gammaproteobacteria bacterium]